MASCRALNVTPHVAQNERRPGGSALDLRTTNWPGYAVSQRVRKRVEEIFGWIKTVGNFRPERLSREVGDLTPRHGKPCMISRLTSCSVWPT